MSGQYRERHLPGGDELGKPSENRPLRVLVLTRYSRMGASSRIRFLQFIDGFERSGTDSPSFEVFPLLEDEYLHKLYAGEGRNPAYILQRYLKRSGLLLSSGRYDLVWIEKELFPGLPALAERLMGALGIKMLIDYDDATFVWYRNNPNWLIRKFIGRKIDVVMRSAHAVVVGNDFLARYAKDIGVNNVSVVPSVVDLECDPDQAAPRRQDSGFTMGWMGTPSTARYLEVFADCLRDLTVNDGVTFLTVGAPEGLLPGVPQEAHTWSEATESALLSRCDVALAPLDRQSADSEIHALRHGALPTGSWERGKCAFKVVKSMAAGLPVIASPYGMATEIINHGENGFFAGDSADCAAIMRRLKSDIHERQRVGHAARETVERLYSTAAVGHTLKAALYDAMREKALMPVAGVEAAA